MLLISANPHHFTPRKKRKTATARKGTKGATMAKRHRSAAQKAATRKMLAANKRRKTHRNPTARKVTKRRRSVTHHNPVRARRRVRRNPGLLGGLTGGGGILKDLISKDGLMMVAGAMAAPMVTDYLQEKIMPTATGWTKVAIKGGLVLAVAYGIDKFLKLRKVALAYGVTGAAVVASDAVQIGRGVMAGLSASEADLVANRPDLVARIAQGSGYKTGMADYAPGLAEGASVGAGSFNSPFSSPF